MLIYSDTEMCLLFADKVGIKTTVKAIAAAKYIKSLPDPVTRADFLKCKYFCSRGELPVANNVKILPLYFFYIYFIFP